MMRLYNCEEFNYHQPQRDSLARILPTYI
jgi:hypothetical protein